MRQIILCYGLIVLLTTTVQGQEKLEWSASRKLTVNDFKGSPPESGTKQTLIAAFGLEIHMTGPEIKTLKTFNAQVTIFFSTNDSWIDWTQKSRLRYSITLFDLNEWMARELRKRLNDNRTLAITGGHEKIRQEVQDEFNNVRQEYDNETNSGDDLMGQMKWESLINERLISLEDYCKTCVPR